MEYPIRILCVFSTLDRGGAETMCMDLYRNIDRTKVQFDFVKHTHKKCAYEEEILALGGKIFEAPTYKVYNHIAYCKWWNNFFKEHKEYQVIHGHYFTISSIFFKIAKKYNRYTIAHLHTAEYKIKNIRALVQQFYINKIEKYADYCFACSQDAGKWLFHNKPFKVLNNAIKLDEFKLQKNFSPILEKNDNELFIGVVCRFCEPKNPIGILKIIEEVSKLNKNAKLIWAGDGPMRKQIEEYIQEHNLANKVDLLGVRKDVSKILQQIDAFIMPSFYEGFGISCLEAQACGIKCFVSDTMPREVDVTGRVSFLPLDDYKLWAETILSADLTKVDTTEQIRKAGYDIKQTSKEMQEFYIECASKQADRKCNQ